jgi:hypothetical protein
MDSQLKLNFEGENMEKKILNTSIEKSFLVCGSVAGPLYIVLGVIQILIRPGFDPTRHDLSLMSNGNLGWIQITNFVLVGLLTILGAFGVRLVLRGSRGGTWGPLLIGVYGLGLIGAGVFVADPMNGFPLGTPEGSSTVMSSHGLLHFVSGGMGFLAFIAACFVFVNRFNYLKQHGWAVFSGITGMFFFAAFGGIAAGSQAGGTILVVVTLGFTAAVILAWVWLSALFVQLFKRID